MVGSMLQSVEVVDNCEVDKDGGIGSNGNGEELLASKHAVDDCGDVGGIGKGVITDEIWLGDSGVGTDELFCVLLVDCCAVLQKSILQLVWQPKQ